MHKFEALKNPVTLQHGSQKITWGDGKNFVLFAGPDIIEDEGLVLEVGREIQRVTKELGIPWILKCSYDKANRQSLGSFRGPGVDSALKSYTVTGCCGYARVDMRMDASGHIYILEVNPNPDISPDAGASIQAAAAGMSYNEFILKIVQLAMERRFGY